MGKPSNGLTTEAGKRGIRNSIYLVSAERGATKNFAFPVIDNGS